jgi:hypothetical protein
MQAVQAPLSQYSAVCAGGEIVVYAKAVSFVMVLKQWSNIQTE